MQCDFNGDSEVNLWDIALFSGSYGAAAGDPNYREASDLNGDGEVSFPDIGPFINCYGASW